MTVQDPDVPRNNSVPASTNGIGQNRDQDPSSFRTTVSSRDNVFISYPHDDKKELWFRELRAYLKQLERTAKVQVWTDDDIKIGQNWREEIDQQLQTCRVAILVITANTINSGFITDVELPALLDRHMREGLIVHPIIAEPSSYKALPIGRLIEDTQRLIGEEKCLDQLDPPELRRVLQNLVDQIRNDIGQIPSQSTAPGQELVDVVQNEFNVSIIRRIPGGDTSIIYEVKGRNNSLRFVSKIFVVFRLNDEDKAEIQKQVERAKSLTHAAFIRIHKVEFINNYCVALVDHIPGVPLTQYIRQRLLANSGERDFQKVVKILHRLADALVEAHEVDLNYIELTPHQVLIVRDRPYIYPISFSQWLFEREQRRGMYRAPRETVAYLSPEFYYGAKLHDPVIEGHAELYQRTRALLQASHQYSLGMIGLHMLEQAAPFQIRCLADISKLEKFFETPRSRLKEAEWYRKAPGVARIISRMLCRLPSDRWPDMETVSDQLNALIDKAARAHVGEAKASYERICHQNEQFYRSFYQAFLKQSENAEKLFKGTDWPRQYAILDHAISFLLNYRDDQNEPTTLSGTVSSHRGMRLEPQDFRVFGETFLQTLRDFRASNDDVDAWEAVIWPGLNYLVRNCCEETDQLSTLERMKSLPDGQSVR